MRETTLGVVVATLLAAPAAAQICPNAFLRPSLGEGGGMCGGSPCLTPLEAEQTLIDNLDAVCDAAAEDFPTACADGEVLQASSGTLVCAAAATGSSLELDLGNDASLESTALSRVAVTGDTNAIFGEPVADRLLIDVGQNWPAADTATTATTATTANGLGAGALDQISDIDAAVLTGLDTTLVTGTSTSGECATWDANGDLIGSGGACGGSPPAATTTTAGIVELATDGEDAADVVVQGNDSRLDDARTPTAHATGHEDGGSDEVSPLSLSSTGCSDGQVLVANATSGAFDCETPAGGTLPSFPYDPDTAPSSGLVTASSDEFDGSFDATWTWANQGSATDTLEMDTAVLASVGTTNNMRVRWVAAPSGSFRVAARVSAILNDSNPSQIGLVVLITGSESTPTLMHLLRVQRTSATAVTVFHTSNTDYQAGGNTTEGSLILEDNVFNLRPLCISFTWDGTDITSEVAVDCMSWRQIATDAPGSAPQSLGRYVNGAAASGDAQARWFWFRTGQGAAFINGEVGE